MRGESDKTTTWRLKRLRTLHRFGDDAGDSADDTLRARTHTPTRGSQRTHAGRNPNGPRGAGLKATAASHLEKSFPAFGQAPAKIFGGSVHLLSAFLLVLFVHGDGRQAFAHRAGDPGHHARGATCGRRAHTARKSDAPPIGRVTKTKKQRHPANLT